MLQLPWREIRTGRTKLSVQETLLRGSTTAPLWSPGKAHESLLVKKIRHEHEPGMPYKMAKLPDADVAQIVAWVNAGMPYNRPLEITTPAGQVTSLHPGNNHWAFQSVRRPPVPKVTNQGWVRNPIDAFVTAKRDEKKLTPLPAADKRVLIRRVYLISSDFREPAEIQRFCQTNRRMPTKISSIGCWPIRAMESAGDATGWTSGAIGLVWIWWVRDSGPHIWHWRGGLWNR
jgi:hypothetical protein